MPMLSIERRELPAQPFLFVRAKVARSEIRRPSEMAWARPSRTRCKRVRRLPAGPRRAMSRAARGLDLQIGIPIAVAAPGNDDVQAGELPGGPIAVAVHAGAYDSLGDTNAAMERWMDANGYGPAARHGNGT